MRLKLKLFLSIFLLFTFSTYLFPQKNSQTSDSLLNTSVLSGLSFRSIGPAFMSGRISDIAIHPENNHLWYVTAGSGGVWKTNNAGTTWDPIFDDQGSYSIGCITIDPNNHHTIWVGTGENVGGRHVGYGDGVYMSDDGGMSWTNMGLAESEHISKIIVHPENPEIVWVASQGPLWKKGGDRGLYLTKDKGKTWEKTLGDDEWIGVTDIVIDPRNPDRLYAATWQRHRNVAAYMGSGPGTAIYQSSDGGLTWNKLSKGLPSKNMGKIGLAISPQQPDVIYAAIELDRRTGAVYRSENRGASWTKMSDAVSGATGPHYYQELYASPHQFDKIYLMDVRVQVSEDGGKTFTRLKEQHKHSDNHAMAFKMDDPDYLMIGTDGGLYESFDNAENWRFIKNLPLTQFYKVAVDDAYPFYNVYGGTQDNGTQGGPSQTDNRHGILNADWNIILFGDGHQTATEPGNPDIVYAESQEGYLYRTNRSTGEVVFIQPQPEEGAPYERFNWDSPILVSPHNPATIYFASQRIWKSENRGDSWTPISGDLTKNQERLSLPIMDQTWSYESGWDFEAMSNYNTITSLAESPVKKGLIYAGTDDGIIQITENGGESWRKVAVGNITGIPETAFVNDIKADLFDENTVYVVLDNHKYGDLNPYLVKSINKGKSWTLINGDLPERTLLWRFVQDYLNPDLFFLGTEFGVYCSTDGGKKWIQLKSGIPNIPVRDLVIQRRENDLVAASFGRGFYILDDYSPLRTLSEENLQNEALLFQPEDAHWYFSKATLSYSKLGSQGAATFVAPNPPFGATFTYYLKESVKDKKTIRKDKEKELSKNNKDIPFPGWDVLEDEVRESKPKIQLWVKDADEKIIRKINAPSGKGIHRISWNLKAPAQWAIDPDHVSEEDDPAGFMVAPGDYSLTLIKRQEGEILHLAGPVNFRVIPLHDSSPTGSQLEKTVAFWREIESLQGKISALSMEINNTQNKVTAMMVAINRSPGYPVKLDSTLTTIHNSILEMKEQLSGKSVKRKIGEKNDPTIWSWLSAATAGVSYSTYGPTKTHQMSLEIAQSMYEVLRNKLEVLRQQSLPDIEQALIELGAPFIEGQTLPEK